MTHLTGLNELAWELFHIFSRTEYALKASGFNKGDGAADADWRKFAIRIEAFVATPPSAELQAAIDYIFTTPPKKQVIVNGRIEWAILEPHTRSRADKLFLYIRRVRNNLFHGGKFNGHWFDPDRSEELLRHSITILQNAVNAVPSVREAYHDDT